MGPVQYFDLTILFFFGIIGISIASYLRVKQKKSLIYLLFFSVFFVYMYKVLDYTLLQFQSLVVLKYFMPNLILNGQGAGETMNILPLITLTSEDIMTSLLNILLFVPFGFGLPFITNYRMKNIVIIGAVTSVCIEILQFATGIIAGVTFRVADSNDVLFNTLGVLLGYSMFVHVVRIIYNLSHNLRWSKNAFVEYIVNRPQHKAG